jgi:hypothetical protein
MKAWGLLGVAFLSVLFLQAGCLIAADFSVTTPSASAYRFAGLGDNPTLTLERGRTYTFAINAGPTHPFRINSTGASPNNITSGTITYTVPMAESDYSYECSNHHFGNDIITIPPVDPPTVRILNFSVGTNIALKSTGTNGWSVIPEFKINLAATNWTALTVQSNFFADGTNDTICGRPPGTNVFIRVRNQR